MAGRPSVDRRTFLRGTGVSLSLPLLECMAADDAATVDTPKRFIALYVGHGFAVSLKDDSPVREWSWYPTIVAEKMKFGRTMDGFNQLTDKVTVLHGLEHPRCIRSNGHGTADSFLTGSNIGDAVQSPSIDQVAALSHGRKTRYPSLVLGNEGGLGTRGSSKTLSYNQFGRPVPASSDLGRLYDAMFNSDPALQRGNRKRLATGQRLVDRVLESHRDLKRRLGSDDSEKLDHYLHSVRDVEQAIERMRNWSKTPKPVVDATRLSLDASVKDPAVFIRTMYNLIYLAFQTNSTRYATYMLQSMTGGPWDEIPRTALGLKVNHHVLAHNAAGGNTDAMEALGTYDRFQADLLVEFVKKLDETPDVDGTMLDNTIICYGTSNSKTHINRDYPLLLAGGANLGLRHGQFRRLGPQAPPLSNLYLTLLNALDVPVESFSDSTGTLAGIV